MFKNFIRFNPRSKDDPNFNAAFDPGAVIGSRWIRLTEGGARDQVRANGEKPLATTFLNFFSYFPGVAMPIIVSFSKSSYKTGKQLLSLAWFCQKGMFARKYRLTSVMETNDIATYAC